MIRLVGILIGLGFTLVVLVSFGVGAFTYANEERVTTANEAFHLEVKEDVSYPFEGVIASWDVAQLQRGYKVYKQVCSACHSLRQVAFRNLGQLGYSEDEVKAEAATWQVAGLNPDTGEEVRRPATATDYFPSPYANAVQAQAANGGKVPPDLSLITKARHHGTHYVHSLLTGYADPNTYTNAEGQTLAAAYPEAMPGPGNYFNPYYDGLNLGMSPPLIVDGQVTYDDGTTATVDQMATDVAAFLTWTAEPTLVKRKQTGLPVLLFILFATILAWFAKKQIWAGVKRKD